jgi:3-phosphoshikimate 1-carboxyvinyltransferase
VAHLRLKECDRIAVPIQELAKLGADLVERPDGLRVRPVPLRGPARLDPADDHRMAMAFGLVALRVHGLHVENPACVAKSYPGFWDMLEAYR